MYHGGGYAYLPLDTLPQGIPYSLDALSADTLHPRYPNLEIPTPKTSHLTDTQHPQIPYP